MSYKYHSIAITGGIACGKTVASYYFRKHGFEVYSADRISHNILNKKNITQIIVKELGDILTDGRIDRIKLGQVVFGDKKKLEKLNSILHPLVIAEINSIKEKNKGKIIFFEIPLLFETKQEKNFDLIINIYCDKNIQITRLIERNELTKSEAEKRIASQLPQVIKIKGSDINIENNGSLEIFLRKLDDVKKIFWRSKHESAKQS